MPLADVQQVADVEVMPARSVYECAVCRGGSGWPCLNLGHVIRATRKGSAPPRDVADAYEFGGRGLRRGTDTCGARWGEQPAQHAGGNQQHRVFSVARRGQLAAHAPASPRDAAGARGAARGVARRLEAILQTFSLGRK